MNDYTALILVIFPVINRHNFSSRTVNDFPPPFYVISGIDHHQVFRNAFHKWNLQIRLYCGIKSSHHIALLYFVRVCFCPLVILSGSIIGCIYFCPSLDQILRELGAVAVTNSIGSPAFHQFYGFRHHIQVSGNGYPSFF